MPDHDMPDAHLSDELLSAALDGELTAVEQARVDGHLPSCSGCSARLASLRAVAAAVGAVDDMPAAAVVVPFERRRAAVPLAWLAAVAASVMLLAGLAALIGSRGDGDDEFAAVARDSAAENADAETSGPAFAGAAGTGSTAEPVDGGDLGERHEPDDVARAVRDALAGGGAGGAAAPARALAADEGAEAGPTRAPEPTTAAVPARPCVDEARSASGERAGLLRYAALLRYRGTPAVVLAFDLSDGSRQAYVMRLGDCAVLAEPRL